MIPIGDTRRRFGFPWMTVLLLAVCLVDFLYERRTPLSYSVFALIPREVVAGQHLALLQKALTCFFIQGPSWLEPIANLLYFWVLGSKVEDACGPWGLFLLTLLSSISAVAVKVIAQPSAEDPVFGLSGVVAGLFGAYLVLYSLRPILSWVPPMVAKLTPVSSLLHLLYWAGLVFVNVNFRLFWPIKNIPQAVSLEPTWPFAGALVIGLVAGELFARREYIYYRLLQARAQRRAR